jgi:hypothetical protein
MWTTLVTTLGTNNHLSQHPRPTRFCLSVLVAIITETSIVCIRIGEHYVRPGGNLSTPNCRSKELCVFSSSGKGGGTQRGFGSFLPKILSNRLLSSSKGMLNGRGLDPLLIPSPLICLTVRQKSAGSRQKTSFLESSSLLLRYE